MAWPASCATHTATTHASTPTGSSRESSDSSVEEHTQCQRQAWLHRPLTWAASCAWCCLGVAEHCCAVSGRYSEGASGPVKQEAAAPPAPAGPTGSAWRPTKAVQPKRYGVRNSPQNEHQAPYSIAPLQLRLSKRRRSQHACVLSPRFQSAPGIPYAIKPGPTTPTSPTHNELAERAELVLHLARQQLLARLDLVLEGHGPRGPQQLRVQAGRQAGGQAQNQE